MRLFVSFIKKSVEKPSCSLILADRQILCRKKSKPVFLCLFLRGYLQRGTRQIQTVWVCQLQRTAERTVRQRHPASNQYSSCLTKEYYLKVHQDTCFFKCTYLQLWMEFAQLSSFGLISILLHSCYAGWMLQGRLMCIDNLRQLCDCRDGHVSVKKYLQYNTDTY